MSDDRHDPDRRPLRFDDDRWGLGLRGLDADRLPHRESVFALSNGCIGWRGLLDEGEPVGIAGCYANGVFETHPMPYSEPAYGYPTEGQSIVNVPDGQVIRLLVDGEPFDVRTGVLERHEQRLDFRAGTLHREVDWVSPSGSRVRVTSTRLVSYDRPSVAAVRYSVEATDTAVEVTVQSELLANVPVPEGTHPDERIQRMLERPLAPVGDHVLGTAATLVHRLRRRRLRIAAAMDHLVDAPGGARVDTETSPDLARTTVGVRLGPDERLQLMKAVAYEWADDATAGGLRDRADSEVAEALREGWDALADAQRRRLDRFWHAADVVVEGEPRLQQAVRFALFQVFQSAVRLDGRSVPGKGLTGAGYQGHTFWDFEGFVLPVLTSTLPESAREALRWRHATLHLARDRARELHLAGAAFPWRTLDGTESSGYWPASTIGWHVQAAIAAAVIHFHRGTRDETFLRECGAELLIETARLWMSLARRDEDGGVHFDGVTGPDEYSAMVDDNAYTNLMAAQNLRAAASAARSVPDVAERLGAGADEVDGWRDAAARIVVPYDERRGVHQQAAGFTEYARWDFEGTPAEHYPLHDHYPYFSLYRSQVVKQADLVLALYFAYDAFTPEETERAFRYSEAITVRDSSLSACIQAVIAAQVGQLELAADYLAEAATLDLDDVQGDTEDGVHLASLAGIWTALVAGFGGFRDSETEVRFAPRLPPQLTRLAFGIRFCGRVLRVDASTDATTYTLVEGEPVTVRHFDEAVELEVHRPTTRATPPLPDPGPRPTQPKGRAPRPFGEAFGR
ncbi:glycoside hydrolase family 65 protein [Agromyces indicus]|uniref:Glycosyl hydrolase family 65 protein n=1 Tax=Agromyces indicus TaxID=758919 RepID=A0ABU1FHR8_9MICO|nr:glycosyl hydrolase family 65 protein [Agromyces indicus]MDR5691298.1 glycosyl hydrolase family 65 protein [Agromyces indicus]